jgi:hypothetical protein
LDHVLEYVVDAADVRMGHLAGELALANEAALDLVVVQDRLPNRLEGDALVELGVERFVDFSHPPFGQEADDAKPIGDDLARKERMDRARVGYDAERTCVEYGSIEKASRLFVRRKEGKHLAP